MDGSRFLLSAVSQQGYRKPNFKELAADHSRYQRWLMRNETKAFYTPVFAEDLRQGTQYLLQVRNQLRLPSSPFSVCTTTMVHVLLCVCITLNSNKQEFRITQFSLS